MINKSEEILADREKRFIFQNKLINYYKKTLISMQINYPGYYKENYLTNNIVETMDNIVSDIFSCDIHLKIFTINEEGPIVIMIVDKDAIETKNICIAIEEKHILGRCIDLEVYDCNKNIISRTYIGKEKRKCFICNDFVGNCVMNKRHNQAQIIDYFRKKYREYLENFYDESTFII